MSTPPCVTCRIIPDSSSRSRYSGGERLTKVGGALDRSDCEETSDQSVNCLSSVAATRAQGFQLQQECVLKTTLYSSGVVMTGLVYYDLFTATSDV